MLSRDCAPFIAEPSERHMRTKRPFICLPKGPEQDCTELCDLIASDALRPQKTRTSLLRPIADMVKFESEGDTRLSHTTKLRDGVGY